MLKVEAELLKVMKQSDKSRERYRSKIFELRSKLKAVGCSHSLVEDFQWEHDDGYGRQKMITGDRCVLCKAEKHWKGSALWH